MIVIELIYYYLFMSKKEPKRELDLDLDAYLASYLDILLQPGNLTKKKIVAIKKRIKEALEDSVRLALENEDLKLEHDRLMYKYNELRAAHEKLLNQKSLLYRIKKLFT